MVRVGYVVEAFDFKISALAIQGLRFLEHTIGLKPESSEAEIFFERFLLFEDASTEPESARVGRDPSAVPFYKALGFEVVGEVPSGSIAGRSLPHMTIAIDRL